MNLDGIIVIALASAMVAPILLIAGGILYNLYLERSNKVDRAKGPDTLRRKMEGRGRKRRATGRTMKSGLTPAANSLARH